MLLCSATDEGPMMRTTNTGKDKNRMNLVSPPSAHCGRKFEKHAAEMGSPQKFTQLSALLVVMIRGRMRTKTATRPVPSDAACSDICDSCVECFVCVLVVHF